MWRNVFRQKLLKGDKLENLVTVPVRKKGFSLLDFKEHILKF